MDITIIKQEKYSEHPLLKRLLELHDIPQQMYILGNLPEITLDEYGRATPRILTIVGSRKYTQYGKHVLEKLIPTLKSQDVIIISGLAFGIDSLAHITALTNKIRTLAIPGSGLDKKALYPKAHTTLAEEIVESGGALLSELSPLTNAAKWTFPARNRIMAALSDAVLVIEAEEKSGTLITARQALELGKDIGAIPGEIFSPTASGTNILIRDGAYSITSKEDLFSLLNLSLQETENQNENYTDDEQKLLKLLSEPMEKDILLVKSGMPLEKFLALFSLLEVQGVVQETFGEVRRLV